MWERVIWGGGVNLTPSSPRALRRFSLVSSFCHWAAKLHLCTSTSGEAIGSTWRKRIERHSAHFFFHLPSLHPCQAKLSRPSLRREVINFIYTLGPWNQRLSLWAVGVRGLRGSSWQPLLRFFHLIVIWLRKRQKRLGAVPPHPWGSDLASFCLI